MTVAGFEDAIAAAVQVQVSADLTVPVASLAGIAVLKLFAWQDRYTTDKDALDRFGNERGSGNVSRRATDDDLPGALAPKLRYVQTGDMVKVRVKLVADWKNRTRADGNRQCE
jgi:hypothetical protein